MVKINAREILHLSESEKNHSTEQPLHKAHSNESQLFLLFKVFFDGYRNVNFVIEKGQRVRN